MLLESRQDKTAWLCQSMIATILCLRDPGRETQAATNHAAWDFRQRKNQRVGKLPTLKKRKSPHGAGWRIFEGQSCREGN
jgi:hypothetical protein